MLRVTLDETDVAVGGPGLRLREHADGKIEAGDTRGGERIDETTEELASPTTQVEDG